jgi:hypothetical protein
MQKTESILDKVMENKQAENLSQFDPRAVLLDLFSVLNDREQEVLTRRFGLRGSKPQTLELIGKHFGVTRERVRQIETGSIKKLHKVEGLEDSLKSVQSVLFQVLDQHGGILEESHLLDLVLAKYEDSILHRAILLFFMEKLLVDHFDCLHKADEFHRSWKVATVNNDEVTDLIKKLIAHVESHEEPIEEEDLVERALQELEDASEHKVRGHLRISKLLKQNIFDHWGKSDWNSITPKRMNDKIHLVLKHVEKPMHFTDIATKINELNFDHKTAYPATVHNELILDDNYVLVGRGIYALSDWGYQPGVVADVIARVLKKAESALTREEIVDRVLDQRIVGKSTVHLALMNKQRFSKLEDGKYLLVA